MGQLLQLSVLAVAGYIAWAIYSSWSEAARQDRAAREHGCLPPVRAPILDRIFGFDLFIGILKADAAGRRSKLYRSLHQTLGATFEMKALTTAIETAHPENIQAICTSAFADFGVEPMRGSIGAPFLDRGIFTDDGEFWKHSRALVRPTFSRAEIADLDRFEVHVARLLDRIPTDGSTFDIMPMAKLMFLDSSMEFLFGESANSQTPEGSPETDAFMRAFDRSLLGLALLLITGPLRWPLYLDPSWRKAYKEVHTYVDRNVQRALSRRHTKAADEPKRYVLLEEMATHTQDPYELRMQILNVFFPARDTAAIAFSDALFELARCPDEYALLRAEACDAAFPLTFERVKALPVVRSVVNETLRLHPATSKVGRASLRDAVLPRGGGPDGNSPLFVPKGRVVEMDLYTLQRDPAIWGDDADEFRPARWRQQGRPLWEAKWQYEPFLGGVRMCPAQNQVVTQLAYLLTRFARRFEKVHCRDPVDEYLERVAMTVESRNGVLVAVEKAAEAE